MKREEIITNVTSIIRSVLKNNELTIVDNQDLTELENWDSLTQVTIIAQIEKQFSIRFKLLELNRLKIFSEMISIIESKLQ